MRVPIVLVLIAAHRPLSGDQYGDVGHAADVATLD